MNAIVNRVTTSRGLLLAPYLQEIRCEILSVLRTMSFLLPMLLFPPMFYLLFAVVMPLGRGGGGGWQAGHYLLATYLVFGVMAPGLFGFSVSVASDRQHGWLRLKRVAPMPPGAYLGAKLVMAMVCAVVIFVILATLAMTLGGVRLPLSNWLALLATAVFGVLPFCAIGLWVGTVSTDKGAPAIVNLIYLPMGFLSGLWFPLMLLPAFIQKIAPALPAYHLAQLSLSSIGQPASERLYLHIAVLIGVTAMFFLLARRRLAREG